MQRPRNRQPRPGQNPRPSQIGQNPTSTSTSDLNTNRDNRRQGRGRGNPRPSNSNLAPYPSSVPTTTQVIRNARVSIVLKEDQGTGREVQGLVQDVLTSGNHPRGIKVRLVDGRVGRVQRMGWEGEVVSSGVGGGGGSRDGRKGRVSLGRGGRMGGTFTDMRENGYEEGPREGGFSLGDFLVDPNQRRILSGDEGSVERADGGFERGFGGGGGDSQVCPVCGDFEGDEIAVI